MGNLTNRAGKGYGLFSNAKDMLSIFKNAGSSVTNNNDVSDLMDGNDINPRKHKKALDSANGINPFYSEREGKTRQDEFEKREVNRLKQEEQRRLQQAEKCAKKR